MFSTHVLNTICLVQGHSVILSRGHYSFLSNLWPLTKVCMLFISPDVLLRAMGYCTFGPGKKPLFQFSVVPNYLCFLEGEGVLFYDSKLWTLTLCWTAEITSICAAGAVGTVVEEDGKETSFLVTTSRNWPILKYYQRQLKQHKFYRGTVIPMGGGPTLNPTEILFETSAFL